jgi:chromosome segregation ATPase
VFAACERLDAANERWNREDVRREVGGGGFVVIDPLIQAWRALKPLREVAPSTPTELLHQVATSLEAHVTEFTAQAEERQAAQQQIFESTVKDLSERFTGLEQELKATAVELTVTADEKTRLVGVLAQREQALNALQARSRQQAKESEELLGRVTQVEAEREAAIQAHEVEQRARLEEHVKERTRLLTEHTQVLATQRQELLATAEQAENRLLMLLDQARQDAKATEARLADELVKLSRTHQDCKEAAVELRSTVQVQHRERAALERELTAERGRTRALQADLDASKDAYRQLERDFEAYKTAFNLSNDLGSLKEAVEGMQAQLSSARSSRKRGDSAKGKDRK